MSGKSFRFIATGWRDGQQIGIVRFNSKYGVQDSPPDVLKSDFDAWERGDWRNSFIASKPEPKRWEEFGISRREPRDFDLAPVAELNGFLLGTQRKIILEEDEG